MMNVPARGSDRPSRVALGLLAAALAGATPAAAQGKLRGDIERELVPIEAAFRAAPDDAPTRRAYADVLFELGNVWQARDVLAPLATPASAHPSDLRLGARLALLTSDYARAEALYQRLRAVAADDSTRRVALEGLAMVYYQTNRYDRAASIELPNEGDDARGIGNMLVFMKRFPGTPYGIEWSGPDKVAHLPMVNDITAPGALPTVKVEINGHPVSFILDTGGDRLYLDEGLAQPLGIETVSKRRSRYAYTRGEYVDEPLGVADRVKLGEVTLRNVPVIVAKWKVLGQKTDGVVTTQMLKQFLSTIDYANKRITLRERSERGKRQLRDWYGSQATVELPFFMTGSHLMFAKGSLNGHQGMNMLLDSGLAFSMPLVIVNETVEFLGLPKNPVPNTKFFWVPIESHGLGELTRGATQALGNVFVEENPYWQWGFLFDALVSHQYLWHLGSWTIDFDAMKYYFPAASPAPRPA
jgi:hypothetical protein